MRRAALLEFGKVLARVELVLTTFVEAPPIPAADAVHSSEVLRRRTVPTAFNLFGLPVVTVPCGFTESGLPVGL